MGVNLKGNGKGTKQTLEMNHQSAIRSMEQVNGLSAEQLMAGFRARQSSPAYQEMMV
jgi:hypothetical protein